MDYCMRRCWRITASGPRLATLIILFCAFSRAVFAHQDAIFDITSTGKITGVPKKYGPVSIKITNGIKPPLVTVRIGSRKFKLPGCLSRFFEGEEVEELQTTGSWYHNTSDFPPYLSFRIERGCGQILGCGWSTRGSFCGYKFTFNLENGRFISAVEWRDTGAGVAPRILDVAKICTAREREQLKPMRTDEFRRLESR